MTPAMLHVLAVLAALVLSARALQPGVEPVSSAACTASSGIRLADLATTVFNADAMFRRDPRISMASTSVWGRAALFQCGPLGIQDGLLLSTAPISCVVNSCPSNFFSNSFLLPPGIQPLLSSFEYVSNCATLSAPFFTSGDPSINAIVLSFLFAHNELPDSNRAEALSITVDGTECALETLTTPGAAQPIITNSEFWGTDYVVGDAAAHRLWNQRNLQYRFATPLLTARCPLNTQVGLHTLEVAICSGTNDAETTGAAAAVFVSNLQACIDDTCTLSTYNPAVSFNVAWDNGLSEIGTTIPSGHIFSTAPPNTPGFLAALTFTDSSTYGLYPHSNVPIGVTLAREGTELGAHSHNGGDGVSNPAFFSGTLEGDGKYTITVADGVFRDNLDEPNSETVFEFYIDSTPPVVTFHVDPLTDAVDTNTIANNSIASASRAEYYLIPTDIGAGIDQAYPLLASNLHFYKNGVPCTVCAGGLNLTALGPYEVDAPTWRWRAQIPLDGDAVYRLTVLGGAFRDLNSLLSGEASFQFTADATPPVVTIVSVVATAGALSIPFTDGGATNQHIDIVTFTITAFDAYTGLDPANPISLLPPPADITITGPSATCCTAVNPTLATTALNTYTFSFGPIVEDGAYVVSVVTGAVSDLAGNPSAEVHFTFWIDTTPPTVTISSEGITNGSCQTTPSLPVDFQLQFEDNVALNSLSVVDITAIHILKNGVPCTNCAFAPTLSGTFPSLFVTVTALDGDGVYTIYVAAGAILDSAGNALLETSFIFSIDNTSPIVDITAIAHTPAGDFVVVNGRGVPQLVSSVDYTITVRDTGCGIASTDPNLFLYRHNLVVCTACSVGAMQLVQSSPGQYVYTLQVAALDGVGVYTLRVEQAFATDVAGNTNQLKTFTFYTSYRTPAIVFQANTWANFSGVGFTVGDTINTTQIGSTSAFFTIDTFATPFVGLDPLDILLPSEITLLRGLSTVPCVGCLSGTNALYTFSVNGLIPGTYSVRIAAAALSDRAGNKTPQTAFVFTVVN